MYNKPYVITVTNEEGDYKAPVLVYGDIKDATHAFRRTVLAVLREAAQNHHEVSVLDEYEAFAGEDFPEDLMSPAADYFFETWLPIHDGVQSDVHSRVRQWGSDNMGYVEINLYTPDEIKVEGIGCNG